MLEPEELVHLKHGSGIRDNMIHEIKIDTLEKIKKTPL